MITCRAVTATGAPCRNHRVNSDGFCWVHDGRSAPERKHRDQVLVPRVCKVCGHLRPGRAFGAGCSNAKGQARRRTTCLDCDEKARRAAGSPKRHARYNARGEVWCNNCQRYLHGEAFKRHPSRPHTYWAYCIECTGVMDRMRYSAKVSTASGREAVQTSRNKARRRRRGQELRDRRKFVQEAIGLLLRRGLTKAEVCRLTGTSFGSVIAWEHADRNVCPQVAERFGALLGATSHLRTGSEPCRRRRQPHPELPQLSQIMSEVIDRYPVRSRWAGREGAA